GTLEETEAPTLEPTDIATGTPEATDIATGTAVATCGGNNAHPVATRLAAAFGVSYDEIMGYHCQGIGFGNITKAYLLAKKAGKSAADFFALRQSGEGWGQIMKSEGVKGKDLSLGQAMKGDNGNNSNGNGNGNGNGKGKGKGGTTLA